MVISQGCTFSSGLISVSAKSIKANCGLMDLDYGTMSSMHSIGKVLGSFLFFSLVNVINRKYFLVFAGIGKSLTVIPFAFCRDGKLLLAIRCLSGFPHVINFYIIFRFFLDYISELGSQTSSQEAIKLLSVELIP